MSREQSQRLLQQRYDQLVEKFSKALKENHKRYTLLEEENKSLRQQIQQLHVELISEQMESQQLADRLRSLEGA